MPRSIAFNMTFPETVSIHNIEAIKLLVQNGPDTHPGARSIIRSDGKRVDLRFVKSQTDQILDYGYIVERQMQDDDCVIFNRQPSLHKMSMMGHRVKVRRPAAAAAPGSLSWRQELHPPGQRGGGSAPATACWTSCRVGHSCLGPSGICCRIRHATSGRPGLVAGVHAEREAQCAGGPPCLQAWSA